jgi:PadR family transcriptional regulator PadR
MSRESLGHFELLVLLAVLREGDEAYGVPIADAITQSTGKSVILASLYNTLQRLEEKGLVRSTMGQPTAQRGGRAKRYFSITSTGLREVRAAKKALTVLWRGVPVHEG